MSNTSSNNPHIEFTSGGKIHRVNFGYEQVPLIGFPGFNTRMTKCRITTMVGLTPIVVAWGQSTCSWQDQFVRESGRKVALRRALSAMNVSKLVRQQAWLAYHSRKVGQQQSPITTNFTGGSNNGSCQ